MMENNNNNCAKNKNINDDYLFISNEFTNLCKNQRYVPTVHNAVNRIIVLGDIHGDYNLVLQLLKIGKVINVTSDEIIWIGGDTVVVQVGDQIDRCRPTIAGRKCNIDPLATINDENSDTKILKLFTKLDKQAIKFGGQVISLLGNHELLNAQGYINFVSKKNIDESIYLNKKTQTLHYGRRARIESFRPGHKYGKFLGCTRVSCLIIGSNLFVHAGLLTKIITDLKITNQDDLIHVDILVRKWLIGLINKEYITHIINSGNVSDDDHHESMFWTRVLGNLPPDLSYEHCKKDIGDVLKILQIGNIIVGHTPQSFSDPGKNSNSTCDKKVWRIDNGSSAAFHQFDPNYIKNHTISDSRKPQVLEILNDTEFSVLC